MIRHTASSALLAAAIYFLPLVPVATRLLHPAPWLGWFAAFVTLASQPPVAPREWLDTKAPDRRSVLFIFLAMIGVQLAAVIEFGYTHAGVATAVESLPLTAGICGMALVALGLALRLWAIHELGRWFTATVRMACGQRVVRSGPYRRIRHPSYTGALAVALGVVVTLGSAWGLILLLAVAIPAYLYRIKVEEASLVAALGGEYEQYRRASWRLLPRVY